MRPRYCAIDIVEKISHNGQEIVQQILHALIVQLGISVEYLSGNGFGLGLTHDDPDSVENLLDTVECALTHLSVNGIQTTRTTSVHQMTVEHSVARTAYVVETLHDFFARLLGKALGTIELRNGSRKLYNVVRELYLGTTNNKQHNGSPVLECSGTPSRRFENGDVWAWSSSF